MIHLKQIAVKTGAEDFIVAPDRSVKGALPLACEYLRSLVNVLGPEHLPIQVEGEFVGHNRVAAAL